MNVLFRLYGWWLRCREASRRRSELSREIGNLERRDIK